MSISGFVMLTDESARRIAGSSMAWGQTAVAYDSVNAISGVVGTSDGARTPVRDVPIKDHAFTRIPPHTRGLWIVTPPRWQGVHAELIRVGQKLAPDELVSFLGEVPPAVVPQELFLLVTRQPGAAAEWTAWAASRLGAVPLDLEILPPPSFDPIQDLGPRWPAGDLGGRVVVVGVGSIGSAAAHALARYGVRDLVLVDPDRLRTHNLVRHQGDRADIGRYKVDAVGDAIGQHWPGTRVTALREDVLAGADRMRPLFADSALVVCTADGVAARRCVSHLAHRSGCTSVFACVLRDGALGEVLRVWPGSACLMCARAALVKDGSLDPEPELDAGYGAGDSHRPMTAVGPDVAVVGALAAKIAVATLLEEAGHYEHVVRQDWVLIGLRMDRSAPEPFDLFPGQVHWLPETEARPECPTCGTAGGP